MIPLLIALSLLQQHPIRKPKPMLMSVVPISVTPTDMTSVGFCVNTLEPWVNYIQEDKWYVVKIDGVQQAWAGYPQDDTQLGWGCYYLPNKIYQYTVGQHYLTIAIVIPSYKIPPDAPTECPAGWSCCFPGVDCYGDPGTAQVNCVANPSTILSGPPPAILGPRIVP